MNRTFVIHCRIGALVGLLLGGLTTAAFHLPTLGWTVAFALVGVVVGGAVGSAFIRAGARQYGSVETGALVGCVTAYIVAYVCIGSGQLAAYTLDFNKVMGYGLMDLLMAIPAVVPGALVGMFVDGAISQLD